MSKNCHFQNKFSCTIYFFLHLQQSLFPLRSPFYNVCRMISIAMRDGSWCIKRGIMRSALRLIFPEERYIFYAPLTIVMQQKTKYRPPKNVIRANLSDFIAFSILSNKR